MKIIKLTESDLIKIVKQVLSEQVVQGTGDDPWEYKKEGDKYYARKKGGKNWVLTGGNAEKSIKTKIFGDKTSSTSKPKSTTKTTVTPKTTTTTNTQTKVVPNKVIVNFNPIVVQKTDTFTPYSRDTLKVKGDFIFKSFQEATSMIGNVSKRTFEQLNEIKSKNPFNGKSFVIVNKDAAIASLFDGNFKFITKSSIVTGKFKDTGEKAMTHHEWAENTKNWAKKSPITDEKKKVLNYWEKQKNLLKSDGTIDWSLLKSKNVKDYPLSYTMLKDEGLAITRSGIFKVGAGFESHYAGDPNTVNTFPLVDPKTGDVFAQAVHAYSDKNRGELIKKASSQNVELNKDFTRMGSGCINVDKNFVDTIKKYNPQFVVILPDSGGKVDLTTISMNTWTQKVIDIGDNCVKSLSNLF
jgi:hypothetical protein